MFANGRANFARNFFRAISMVDYDYSSTLNPWDCIRIRLKRTGNKFQLAARTVASIGHSLSEKWSNRCQFFARNALQLISHSIGVASSRSLAMRGPLLGSLSIALTQQVCTCMCVCPCAYICLIVVSIVCLSPKIGLGDLTRRLPAQFTIRWMFTDAVVTSVCGVWG